jgi:hypothetical protein
LRARYGWRPLDDTDTDSQTAMPDPVDRRE